MALDLPISDSAGALVPKARAAVRETLARMPDGRSYTGLVTGRAPLDLDVRTVVTQDSALAPSDSAPADSGTRATIWLQVSSSQNPDWAKDLANQLRTAGQPAEVWDPVAPEESYRVVVGPYQTREAADEAGKKLGRPYFLVVRPPSER